MQSQRVYRIIVVGPKGSGKSQFFNFVQKDITNSINIVSDSIDSCTQNTFSNYFTRQNTNFEFIDTAGSADSSNNDKKNLEKLNLSCNKISNIDILEKINFKELKELDLSYNEISDIKVLWF